MSSGLVARIAARSARADRFIFVLSFVVLVLGAAGGAGWSNVALDAVIAVELERPASAPLYGILSGAFARLPFGEVGFRLSVMSALAGAGVITGVIRAARAWLPKDPVAGYIAALALVITPGFRDAAGFAGPSIVAALGVVWSIAFALEHAREPSARRAIAAVAAAAVVVGCAPWLGGLLVVLLAGWLWQTTSRDVLVGAACALGIVVVVLWIGALGSLPPAASDASVLIAAAGRGAGAIVVGAGLFGAAFGVVTKLPYARWIAGVLAIVGIHGAVVDRDPAVVLAVLALAAAVIPSAVVVFVGSTGGDRRHLVAAVAGVPIVGGALLAGPAFRVDDPGHAPARLAADVAGALPPGPGVFVARRSTTWAALEYAQRVAGYRPDLVLPPPLPPDTAASLAINTVRSGQIAGADVPAWKGDKIELQQSLAFPRARGFQLLLAPPAQAAPVPLVASYASRVGAEQAALLALDRALYEANFHRYDLAARAAGQTERFGAAELAMMATTTSSPARPPLFRFIPNLDALPPGAWMLDLLGDDLAWVSGIDVPLVEAPRARRLHGLWRALWSGELTRDDTRLRELGRAALEATDEMLAAHAQRGATPPAPPKPPTP